LFFLTQLAKHLGFLPGNKYDMQHCYFDLRSGCFVSSMPIRDYLDAQTSCILWQMLNCGIKDLSMFALNRTQRNILLNGLLNYYSIHLGMTNPIRSIGVLNYVFS
jgi:DNA repair protein RecO (recombination protein O)